MEENLRLEGRAVLTAVDHKTRKIVKIIKVKNLVITVGKEFIGDVLIGAETTNTELTYCAIGTSSTTPAVSDTTLGTEAARKAITSRTRSGNEITLSTFFTASESTYNIQEAGIFGKDASSTLNSGTLFSHWLVAFDNSSGLYDLTFDYILTIG